MKNKKIIIITVLIILLSALYLINKNKINKPIKVDKFKIENKYYNNKGLKETNKKELKKLIKNKESFILFTYNNYCNFSIPCDTIFQTSAKENNIEILQIPFEQFKTISLYKTVKYAPSVIIIYKGQIIDYLDANKDEDIKLYQDTKEFTNWLKKHIIIK